MKHSISVVVPVYNSESSLPELVTRLEPILRSIADRSELVLVNDGSADASWEVIQRLARQHAWIKGVSLMRNYGQHGALLCGIRAARYELVATMDDDLQHPPEELRHLLAALDQGSDVVYGTPKKERHGLMRDMASQATKWALQHAMGAETARNVSAFRLFRTELRDAFSDCQGPFVSIDVLLTWATRKFTAVRVQHDSRRLGQSSYTLGKLIITALNLTTGFSALPLHFASLTGFALTLFGFTVLVYVIGRYLLEGGSVPGFPFLASIVAVFSGAQLFALGIIGEYLARIHFRTMGRPPYAVRAVTESASAE
jgi:undecaprenyl-phosphate 4-deoxy-4-formamido-L-arabinose transferase